MAWVLSKSIQALRSSVNRRFPNRAKDSDGTIGDQAHQGSPSGHNPDETGNPEYTDTDSKDEVRAADIDKDLNDPNFSMQDLINAILASPEDRSRLRYIIFNRKIWRSRNNWREETYTGSNSHTSHGHFSSGPEADEDSRPWKSIENLGRIAEMADSINVDRANWRIHAMYNDLAELDGGDMAGEDNKLRARLNAIDSALADITAAIAEPVTVTLSAEDRQAIIDGLTTGMRAMVREELAARFADAGDVEE